MSELFAQQSLGPEAWATLGPPTAAAATLHTDLLVSYADGSADTIAAGTSTASVDTTADVYVVTTVHGSLALVATKESLLASLGGDWAGLVRLAAGRILPYQPSSGGTGTGTEVAALEFVLDGGGDVLPTGVQGRLVVPFGCTLTSAELLADTSGSLVVDIWKSSYFGYPPSVTNTITASTPLTLSTAQKTQDTVLTGWTTNFVLGDILVFDVVSCATITACSVILRVTT